MSNVIAGGVLRPGDIAMVFQKCSSFAMMRLTPSPTVGRCLFMCEDISGVVLPGTLGLVLAVIHDVDRPCPSGQQTIVMLLIKGVPGWVYATAVAPMMALRSTVPLDTGTVAQL